jgi:transcriptional regulator with XRE-family HTH domain
MILKMSQFRKDLAERIRTLREDRDLSQKVLGSRSKVSWRSIQNAEQGKSDLGAESLAALAKAFDVSLDHLILGSRKRIGKDTLVITIIRKLIKLEDDALSFLLAFIETDERLSLPKPTSQLKKPD